MSNQNTTHNSTTCQLDSDDNVLVPLDFENATHELTCTCGATLRDDTQPNGTILYTCEQCSVTLGIDGWQRYHTDAAFRAGYTAPVANVKAHIIERNARMTSPIQYAVFKLEKNGESTRVAVDYTTEYAEQELKIVRKNFERDGYTVKGVVTQLSETEAQKYVVR